MNPNDMQAAPPVASVLFSTAPSQKYIPPPLRERRGSGGSNRSSQTSAALATRHDDPLRSPSIRASAGGGGIPRANAPWQSTPDDRSVLSVATSKVSIHASKHLEQRAQERVVSHRELQEVRKHGTRYSINYYGQQRYKFVHGNLCYITADEAGKIGITCFRISPLRAPTMLSADERELIRAVGIDHNCHRDLETVKRLVAAGVNPNITDEKGHTCIMLSLGALHPDSIVTEPEVLEFLCQCKGIDLDAFENKFGNTALHWSVSRANHESVRILLKYGADWRVRDKDGQTPLDMADSGKLYGYHDYPGITIKQRQDLIISYLQNAEDAFNAEEDLFLKVAALE